MSLVYRDQPDQFWSFDRRRINTKSQTSWLPRKCYLSGKSIWFKKCVVVTSAILGPGLPVIENYWCDSKEFLLHEMKRNI
jgi:hypothetical protein